MAKVTTGAGGVSRSLGFVPALCRVTSPVRAAALLASAVACGGAPDHPPGDTVSAESRAAPAPPVAPVPADEQGRIALGGDIFNGRAAGGVCYTCHGQDGTGTQLAPNLRDQTWIHGDGRVEFIANVIRTGVAQPKQHPSAMPGFAGMLTDDQIGAVAAYVHSLSRGGV